jgi:hypothetical protein
MDTSPLHLTFAVGDASYTVLRVGTPVSSRGANASFLRSLDFTAADLTVVGLEPLSEHDSQVAYVAWCTQAPVQKLVKPDLLKALLAEAVAKGVNVPAEPAHTTLPDGRVVHFPSTPLAPCSKKRKTAPAEAPVEALKEGRFVLADELLAGGKVHPQVKSVELFEGGRIRHLVAFAEMLLCMHTSPSVEQLHSWARSALGN